MKCWHWEPYRSIVRFTGGAATSELWGARVRCGESNASDCFHSVPAPVTQSDFPYLSVVGQYELWERDSLASALTVAPSTSDPVLLLAAYSRWGSETVKHLSGRFSFAIWNSLQGSLFACRDPLGSLPFVYSVRSDQIAFASDMETMLEGFELPRVLNGDVLTACYVAKTCSFTPGETLFRGILSLPPGHYLKATADNIQVRQYWEPSIRPELVPVRDEEVFEKTEELVERAVARWIGARKSVGLLLSGGLDSSVLAAVTARHLRKTNRTLLALGAVNQFCDPAIPDERAHMEALSSIDNMEIRYVSAEDRGPFDDIEDPSRFYTSCIRFSRKFLSHELASVAEAHGVETLLGGGGGEATITNSPQPFLLECAASFRIDRLRCQLRALQESRGHSAARILASEFRNHVMPRKPGPSRYAFTKGFLAAHPVRFFPRYPLMPDTRRRNLQELRRALACDSLFSTRPRLSLHAPQEPLRDLALVEFCLAVPGHYKVRNGFRRYLARRAFQHILPPAAAWRVTHMPFSPDYHHRYNAQLPKAVEFLRAIGKSDPVREVVDVDLLRKLAQPVTPEITFRYSPAIGSVPLSIYLINFLRQFPAYRN